MLNLFGKKSEEKKEVIEVSKTSNQIVAEIHNEFDTAQERLLEQADKMLAELNIPTETNIEKKAERLKALGFIKSQPVSEAVNLFNIRKEQTEIVANTRAEAELIRYYKQKYPFNKFITEVELDRICDKYGLIYAPVSAYIKDVPDKNLKEIEDTQKLYDLDILPIVSKITITKFWADTSDEFKSFVKSNTLIIESHQPIIEINESHVRVALDKAGYVGDSGAKYLFNTATRETVNKSGFFIAAPSTYFDLTGLTGKTKNSFFNVTIKEINDPIVFRYCRGGILVDSKWGLEGQDELLVNEKLN